MNSVQTCKGSLRQHNKATQKYGHRTGDDATRSKLNTEKPGDRNKLVLNWGRIQTADSNLGSGHSSKTPHRRENHNPKRKSTTPGYYTAPLTKPPTLSPRGETLITTAGNSFVRERRRESPRSSATYRGVRGITSACDDGRCAATAARDSAGRSSRDGMDERASGRGDGWM